MEKFGMESKIKSKRYLNIALADSNNDVLIKYAKVWNGIKDQIKKINNGSVVHFKKIKNRLILIMQTLKK